MPLISASNPDVLDVANIEDHASNSMLKRHSPVTIHNSCEDVVSVMTLHSAFQTGAEYGNSSSRPNRNPTFTPALQSLLFRKDRDRNERHINNNLAIDEFSMDSLPIQDSDIESVEQVWLEEQRKVDDALHRSKKFSSQTYSNKGTVRSSLHRFKGDQDEKSTSSKSVAVSTIGDQSYQNSSKTRGAARFFSMAPSNLSASAYAGDGRSSNKNRRNTGVPRSKELSSSRGSASTREGTKSTINETNSTGTDPSKDSTDSTLEKEMFRLSLELANTLGNLDISNSEVARYRKQVEQLQRRVETLETEKAVYKCKLEGYERKITMESEAIKRRESTYKIAPPCVTPSRTCGAITDNNHEPSTFFSPDPSQNSSFSDPIHGSKDRSGILFPELNDSHISCPDLYTSHIHDDLGKAIEEEEEQDELQSTVDASVDLIDPRDEVFDDDPFATLNYSNENGSASVSSSSNYGVEDTVKTSKAELSKSRVIETANSSTIALSHFTDKFPFRKKVQNSANSYIEAKSTFREDAETQQTLQRDVPHFLNRSTMSNMNISRIFKFGDGKNEDALSVSLRSYSSVSSRRSKFFNFGKQ